MIEDDFTTRDRIDSTLQAFENRDAVAAASTYAEDGIFFDPQYPEPEYHGRETIREAFDWALTTVVEQPEYTVRNFVGAVAVYAVEVETHYVVKDGSEREFPQVFIVEDGDEGITRWRTYLPFPPDWTRDRRPMSSRNHDT